MTSPTMTSGDWALLAMLSVLWGGSFIFVELIVPALPPLTTVWLRVAIAAAALALLLLATGARPRLSGAFFVMALLNNVVPFTLFVWAQAALTGGLAAILNATTPIWAVLLGQLLTTGERATPARLLGVGIGFAGVATLLGGAGPAQPLLPQLACLGATFAYALAGLYGRRFRQAGIGPLAAATGQLGAAALLLLPAMLLVDRPWQLAMPGAGVWAALAGLALLSTAAAFLLYFRLLARVGPTNLLLVTFLIPVTAVLLGVLLLGEPLIARQLAGMALVALGLVAIDGRLVRRLATRTAPAPGIHRRRDI